MRLYGLIGYPLTHSFSEKYFTAKFEEEGIDDCRYKLFPIKSIEELPSLLRDHPDLRGLNVTIPYKKQVMDHLDDSASIPSALNACNCIDIRGGKLTGHNTDWIGFRDSISPLLQSHHTNALILGNGGATAAVVFALNELGIRSQIVSRTPGKDALLYSDIASEIMNDHTLIVNTTPLGMYPNTDAAPSIPYQFLSKKHLLYDLLYNPDKTLFLQKGEELGATIKNGEEMLVIQAEESWKIWNR